MCEHDFTRQVEYSEFQLDAVPEIKFGQTAAVHGRLIRDIDP